jgi:prevent-host-death family protein
MKTRPLILSEAPARYASGNQVTAADFKARCLQLMDDVHAKGGSIVITKRGKPIARLVPIEDPKRRDIFGCLAHLYSVDPSLGPRDLPPSDADDWEFLKEMDEFDARWKEQNRRTRAGQSAEARKRTPTKRLSKRR